MADATDPRGSAREAFLAAYRADLIAGRIRSLAEYQAQFPGHDESLADEWQWLEPDTTGVEPVAADPAARRTIGPYRILAELGHGAQATVYLAEHRTLRRKVALKVLRTPPGDGTTRAEQRFRREAEVTASLEHPNICSVYEAGIADGAAWIAMQYVPGETLATHLARPRDTKSTMVVQLPADQPDSATGSGTSSSGSTPRSDVMRVVAFAEQVARGLHAAHERGLVHRDVKPGNLIVAEDGHPVILDFGLARTGDREGLGLTRTKDVLGTPYYMAPELLQDGQDIDRRTDVYALGVTLYECLTRRRPFDAVAIESLYQQILSVDAPSLRKFNPQIPRDLDVVVLTAIEKDRNRRYQTALDLAEDLRRVRQYEPVRARPVSSLGRLVRLAQRHPVAALSLSIAVAALTVGLLFSLWSLREANQALAERDATAATLYDTVSLRSASDNLRRANGVTLMQQKLRDRAVAEIRRADARLQVELVGILEELLNGAPHAEPSGMLEVLDRARDLQDPIGRRAAADLLEPVVRRQMAVELLDPDAARWDVVVTLAERHLALLADLPPDDDRKLRGRVLLLDVLNQSGRHADAERRVRPWLQEEIGLHATGRGEAARVALYRSRLAAALSGLGDVAQALEILETQRVLAVLEAEFPRSWLTNVSHADLVCARERARVPAAQARRDLGRSLRLSLSHRIYGHIPVYAARTLFGAAHRELWNRLVAADRASYTGHVDVDALQNGVPATIDDDVAACVYLFFAQELANLVRMAQADVSHPDVGALTRLAAEYCRDTASCHDLTRVRAYAAYGEHLLAAGRGEEAETWLLRARDACPIRERWFVGLRLGELRASQGDYERGRVLLEWSLTEGARWYGPVGGPAVEARNSLVRLHRLAGDLPGALAWHDESAARRPRSSFEPRFRAGTLLQFGDLAAAEREVDRVLAEFPDDFHAPWNKARILLRRGDFDGALAQAERAEKFAAEVVRTMRERAAQAISGGQPAAAGPAHRRESFARVAVARAARVRAMALFRRGRATDLRAALAAFAAAAARPVLVDGDGFWSDYGAAWVASDAADQGRQILHELTRARPSDPVAWCERARFLSVTGGLGPADRQEAVRCAQRAAALCKRGRAFVLATLAEAQFRAGDRAAARATMGEVVKKLAGRPAQWLSAAQAAAQLARYE